MADWNQVEANAAYEAQVRQAEEEERQRAEAEAIWLEQQSLLAPAPLEPPKRKPGRQKKQDLALPHSITQDSEHVQENIERQVHTEGNINPNLLQAMPWEPLEDFVLCTVVHTLLGSNRSMKQESVWAAASGALAAGSATASLAGTAEAARKGRLRTKERCKERFQQLYSAYKFAHRKEPGLDDSLLSPVKSMVAIIRTAEKNSGEYRIALNSVLKGLQCEVDKIDAPQLLEYLQNIRSYASRELVSDGRERPSLLGSISAEETKFMSKMIGNQCGLQAISHISSKLPAIIEASRLDSAYQNFPPEEVPRAGSTPLDQGNMLGPASNFQSTYSPLNMPAPFLVSQQLLPQIQPRMTHPAVAQQGMGLNPGSVISNSNGPQAQLNQAYIAYMWNLLLRSQAAGDPNAAGRLAALQRILSSQQSQENSNLRGQP